MRFLVVLVLILYFRVGLACPKISRWGLLSKSLSSSSNAMDDNMFLDEYISYTSTILWCKPCQACCRKCSAGTPKRRHSDFKLLLSWRSKSASSCGSRHGQFQEVCKTHGRQKTSMTYLLDPLGVTDADFDIVALHGSFAKFAAAFRDPRRLAGIPLPS